MRRRAVVLGAVALASGGCLGRDGGSADDRSTVARESGTPTAGGTEGAAARAAKARLLRRRLERRGLRVREVTVEADTIEVRVQTTGNVTDDMRIVAGVYATEADVFDRDLSVQVEDRGLYEAQFEIRREWARRFADGRLSDEEYLRRINETRPRRRR